MGPLVADINGFKGGDRGANIGIGGDRKFQPLHGAPGSPAIFGGHTGKGGFRGVGHHNATVDIQNFPQPFNGLLPNGGQV